MQLIGRITHDSFGSGEDFGINRTNLQILQMIHAKYSKEYLPYFTLLSTMYGNSKRGKEIREGVIWINRVRSVIETAIFGGKVSNDQVTDLYELFDKIEERKQTLIDEVQQNQALQQKMNKVSQAVGVSVVDLNITKDMLKAGVKQAKKKGADHDSKRKYPETSQLIKRISEGVKVAALGPFSPVFDLVSDLGKTLVSQHKRDKKRDDSKVMTGLGLRMAGGSSLSSPMSALTPETNVAQMTVPTPPLGVDSMFHFFNTKAYKAKWTKELLDYTKKAGRVGADSGSLLRVSGNILKSAALIAGAVVSIKKLVDLLNVSAEAKEAGRKAVIAGTTLGKVIAKRDAEYQSIGLDAAAAKYGTTPRQIIKESTKSEYIRQKTIESGIKAQEPVLARIGRVTPVGAAARWIADKVYGNKPRVQSVEEIQKQYERKFNYTPVKIDTKQIDEVVKGAMKRMEETSKSVDRLTEKIGDNRNEIKPVSTGNPFESADPWVTQLSYGRLTIGGK